MNLVNDPWGTIREQYWRMVYDRRGQKRPVPKEDMIKFIQKWPNKAGMRSLQDLTCDIKFFERFYCGEGSLGFDPSRCTPAIMESDIEAAKKLQQTILRAYRNLFSLMSWLNNMHPLCLMDPYLGQRLNRFINFLCQQPNMKSQVAMTNMEQVSLLPFRGGYFPPPQLCNDKWWLENRDNNSAELALIYALAEFVGYSFFFFRGWENIVFPHLWPNGHNVVRRDCLNLMANDIKNTRLYELQQYPIRLLTVWPECGSQPGQRLESRYADFLYVSFSQQEISHRTKVVLSTQVRITQRTECCYYSFWEVLLGYALKYVVENDSESLTARLGQYDLTKLVQGSDYARVIFNLVLA
jgi:hypothetical protein